MIINIFCNIDTSLLSHRVVPSSLFDHYLQLVCQRQKCVPEVCRESVTLKRRFKDPFNIAKFRHSLSEVNWPDLMVGANVDEDFKIFLDICIEFVEKSFPLEPYRNRKYDDKSKPWLTADIVQRNALLRDLDKVRNENNDHSITESYKRMLAPHEENVRKAKENYNSEHISGSSNQNKAAYKIINNEFNLKSESKYPTNFTDDENK
ncbi:hypothetical protein HHI36_008789 [Cryptolaemus montrouzieri]|uniref:Uncharacterized protein n=1 Tax=Cryptolaemus montrouzieri TaxID=559131 RepID=A0ABD2MTK4_9CUCU